jgi:glyoxylase-like metal-dependent hydrolase (beta-lactamase superfamily II)
LRAPSAPYAGVYEPNVYLVVDGGSAIIIDGGLKDEAAANERLAYLSNLGGPRVESIALTHHHRDHAGGAFLLAAATGAPVRMHAEEQRLLREDLTRRHPDVRLGPPLVDGETLSVGHRTLRVLHTPGHSAGHLCFFLEEEATLFSGDNVLGLGTTAIPPPPDGDMALYVQSLERMKALGASLLCPGHGPLVREPERKIQELIDHRHEREEQLLSLLREGELSVDALVRRIYPELSPHLIRMATGQVIAHLSKLRDEGRVRLRTEDGEIVAARCPSTG